MLDWTTAFFNETLSCPYVERPAAYSYCQLLFQRTYGISAVCCLDQSYLREQTSLENDSQSTFLHPFFPFFILIDKLLELCPLL